MTKDKKAAKTKDTGKNKEIEDQLKRALADYQNLERRVEEERKLLSSLSSAILIEKFLPILDNLENAQKHLNDQGLEMVIKQFKEILEREGIEEISAEGAQFDPHLHEAVEVIAGKKDNMVVKVLRKGYKINDKVLRPAQVAVGSAQDQNEEEVDQKAETQNEYETN